MAQWVATGLHKWDVLFLGLVAMMVGNGTSTITFQLLGMTTQEIFPGHRPVDLGVLGWMDLLQGLLGRRSR